MSYVYDIYVLCICLVSDQIWFDQNRGGGISFLYFNSYYLTGILSVQYNKIKTNTSLVGFTDIKYHLKWIRGILNKHVRKNISFQFYILMYYIDLFFNGIKTKIF